MPAVETSVTDTETIKKCVCVCASLLVENEIKKPHGGHEQGKHSAAVSLDNRLIKGLRFNSRNL